MVSTASISMRSRQALASFYPNVIKLNEVLLSYILQAYTASRRIYYCILDGAEVNRQFIKLHFDDECDAIERKFVAHNMFTGKPMVFLMDPKVSLVRLYTF